MKETRRHRRWIGGLLGKAPGGIVPPRQGAGQVLPPAPCPADARWGRGGPSLTWLVTWNEGRKHNLGKHPFQLQSPAAPDLLRPGLTSDFASSRGSLQPSMARDEGRDHRLTRWPAPPAANTSSSFSRPSRPGARSGSGGSGNKHICVTHPYCQLNISFKEIFISKDIFVGKGPKAVEIPCEGKDLLASGCHLPLLTCRRGLFQSAHTRSPPALSALARRLAAARGIDPHQV